MAASHAWRTNLILLVLLSAFGVCGFLVWQRRVAWHVVERLPGYLPYRGSPVPYVHDPAKGTITLLDTREVIQLPAEYLGNLDICKFPASRSCILFSREEGDPLHCWDVAAGREVPLPKVGDRNWRLSDGGSRILAMQFPDEGPRRFQVLGLDGSVLQERVLPELSAQHVAQREVRHAFTPEGNYLIVQYREPTVEARIRILDMKSGKQWSFDDQFVALGDEGLLWLSHGAQKNEFGRPMGLRAVRLETGKEIWSAAVPEGVHDLKSLGKGKLGVLLDGAETLALLILDAESGRELFRAEDWGKEEHNDSLSDLDLRAAGSESFLVHPYGSVWSARTGRRLPLKGPVNWIEFFDDGRRALIDVKCGWPGRVVDTDTGKELHFFAPPPSEVVGPRVRLAGPLVLTDDGVNPIQVWERRYPEGWKGHLVRPEVLLAVFLGATMLLVWANRPRAV